MKITSRKKIRLAWLLPAALVLCLHFAGAAKPPSDKGDHVVTGGDLAFMNEAAPGGLAEVQLGELAEKKATDPTVKAFAQKMVADHSKAGQNLEKLAQQKKVKLTPGILPEAKQTKEKLSKLTGAAFDRAYVQTMVTAHEKDVAAFAAVAKNATDADVKSFAAETLPTVKEHLEMIQGLAKTMNVPKK
ncbi:MAG: DUF4142 domain-containing protein [Chthoniobacterales bacterium]